MSNYSAISSAQSSGFSLMNFAIKLIQSVSSAITASTPLERKKSSLPPKDAEMVMADGVDWLMLGRAAILHHDFPNRYEVNPSFEPIKIPVSREYLVSEGLSTKFVEYMSGWKGFVE